jgi:hypothetical protein
MRRVLDGRRPAVITLTERDNVFELDLTPVHRSKH